MAKGNYIVSAIDENTTILFQLSPEADQDIPAEQNELLFDVQATLEVVRQLYIKDKKLFAHYFDMLLKLAQVGLVGAAAQPPLAKMALAQLKTEVTNRESGRVKNDYLKNLGLKALLLGLPALIIGAVISYCNCKWVCVDCLNCGCIARLFILWAGSMAGVWLSFAITRTYLSFDDLAILEKDRLNPFLRLIFTGLLALIFALLFIKKAIVINLGGLSSNDICSEPVSALLIGVILGLNEKIIGSTLTKKTAELFK
jgi:hypothetical protein